MNKTSSVIVIDDDEDVVNVFSEFLRLNGVDVKATTSNGEGRTGIIPAVQARCGGVGSHHARI